MKYRYAIAQIQENTGKKFEVLHLLGGGTKDTFLCQMTADALGFPVVAGPTEATALGNIMLQLIALGAIKDVAEGRKLIRKTESKVCNRAKELRWLLSGRYLQDRSRKTCVYDPDQCCGRGHLVHS